MDKQQPLKSSDDARQQRMHVAKKEAEHRAGKPQPNDIAERTNMKRQAKGMHQQHGK